MGQYLHCPITWCDWLTIGTVYKYVYILSSCQIHIPNASGSLIVAINPETEEHFAGSPFYYFTFSKNITSTKFHIFSKIYRRNIASGA
jgi:hypothetical protein